MKWYGLNISKFCGILVSSNTPVTDEPIFLAHIPPVKRVFRVLANTHNLEQFIVNPVRNNRTFKVTQTTAEAVSHIAVFNKPKREFTVIQN